ncbi:unnamed protein product [Vitrella brassicaformis CCMP3155]|uniref:Uncharacterized protein n=2 Tax=Vitrella brassicaformis TaxID=1169539 RepID=A0A0G4H438_VITBC|nr:unnamed protein product [Vitrella brassicaformis CCMP3155]|eukprot:CEM38514.1 unnamed protein product [Vitrella brassicaformis CCMP3155]
MFGEDDIFEAVDKGDLLGVTQLLDKHGKEMLDTRDEDSLGKYTPFITAALKGHVEIMEVMYDSYGPSILQQKTDTGATALHAAAWGKNLAAVNQLLAWDPKLIDGRSNTKRTAFHEAADRNAVDVMKVIHAIKGNKVKELLAETDNGGNTALHMAVTYRDNLAAAAQLCEWSGGQLLDIKNNEGVTPWDMAAEKPKMRKAIEKYKQSGSSPGFQGAGVSSSSEQPEDLQSCPARDDIFEPVTKGSVPAVIQLIDKHGKKILETRHEDTGAKATPFIVAARWGYVAIMNIMYIRYGPSILQQRDNTNASALHWAAFYMHLEVVNQLLVWDPKLIDARNDTKQTAFHKATESDAVDVMKAMHAIKGNALLTETDNNEDTALHRAIDCGKSAAAAQLCEWGGPQLLHIRNNKGVTPWDMSAEMPTMRKAIEKYMAMSIFEAVDKGDLLGVTQILDKHGKEMLDTRDEELGATPFIEAAAKGHVAIMKVMYDRYGSSILQQRDNNGRTALHWAAWGKKLAAVNQLLAWDPKLIDARSNTVFYTAVQREAVDVMKAVRAIKGNKQKELLTETGYDGKTALHVAASWGRPDAAVQLLEWGGSQGSQLLDTKNDEGVTPWDMTAEKPKMRKAIEKYKQ